MSGIGLIDIYWILGDFSVTVVFGFPAPVFVPAVAVVSIVVEVWLEILGKDRQQRVLDEL
jgi:hypothetical protein